MDSSTVVHLLESAVFYFAGFLLATCINRLSGKKTVSARMFGIGGVVICCVFFLLSASNGQAAPGVAVGGSDAFEQGRAQGYGFMSAIAPGICVILLAGIFGKSEKGGESDLGSRTSDAAAKPKKKLGDRIATAIFWIFAVFLLLIVVGIALRPH